MTEDQKQKFAEHVEDNEQALDILWDCYRDLEGRCFDGRPALDSFPLLLSAICRLDYKPKPKTLTVKLLAFLDKMHVQYHNATHSSLSNREYPFGCKHVMCTDGLCNDVHMLKTELRKDGSV